ncbi:signal transduction histidine kinase [Sulfitobacter undariae]|uniref:histidine kinase n=1 Tax=Sulfitobacter undariae TaxID=1563671 RepID=A0A7W6ECC0_9RHOB|nr:HAMP domain-containing sensor histidine kinase [Sulfitobacter undariae]MBB3995174.1 signal transduction histidine kinase [Sulfitobacter undariae]
MEMHKMTSIIGTFGRGNSRLPIIGRMKDYAIVGQKALVQRTLIYSTALFLAGFYYSTMVSVWFFVAIAACEIYDFLLLRCISNSNATKPMNVRRTMVHIYASTIISAITIALFCVAIAIQQGTYGNHFLPLFLLLSASIFATITNHQFILVLATRLMIYVLAILYIPIMDVWIVRPPITSELWLNLFTVLFVLGFIIELARTFIGGYVIAIKSRRALQIEHKNALAASEAKTRFLATVSHELRTPLTSIKGSLDIINSGRLGAPPEQMVRLLGMAERNSNRLNDLVDDLLLLQSSDAGRLSLNFDHVDLGAVIIGATEAFDAYAKSLKIDLKYDIPEGVYFVDGDAKRLDQVVTNLLSNAAKFSDEKGRVEIEMSRSGGDLILSVSDQGIGIPEDSEATIFEEFGQIDSSDQRKFQGTGLGLAISRRIVQGHGGSIRYESVLGNGTTFYVTLPAAE